MRLGLALTLVALAHAATVQAQDALPTVPPIPAGPTRPAVPGLGGVTPGASIYDGRAGALAVQLPRLEDTIVVDGHLDEPAWSRAAVLAGFSKYAPVDGTPADLRTEVLVWYAPSAIHFGIKAEAPASEVRATLAARDRLEADDQIQIFLGTFDDRRQAFVFAVNPLGSQADGTLVEGGDSKQGYFSGLTSGREPTDLSADFVFQSRGRLTAGGFEVEIRIPFKSLRYQQADPQRWNLHVTRLMPATGREDSWVPARREGASFLGQAGSLEGLTGLRRGLVVDITPSVVARVDGTPDASGDSDGGGTGEPGQPDDWHYDDRDVEAGATVRWGVTPNLTLNGTANPDFSQVEADASQFQYDPRQALFFPEKRPFFLDGLELFETPNTLIYTRRIVAPLGAVKLTGKIGSRTNVGVLSAVDDRATSADGDQYPVFNVLRYQRDLGRQSTVGLVYTDRVEGPDFNRVAGADTRLVFREIYNLQLQAAASVTNVGAATETAPLWEAVAERKGRRYSFRGLLRGIDDEFVAGAGFTRRTGVATAQLTNQVTFYGGQHSPLEKWTGDVVVDGSWVYDDFVAGRASQDRKLHFNANFSFKGGWRAGASLLVESFGYDPTLYEDYALGLETPDGVTLLPFVGTPRLYNLDYLVSWSTPSRGGVSLDGFALWGRDENFFEWASADIIYADAGLAWRPTEQLRLDARYQLQSFERRSDGSKVGVRAIPRVKLEYQMTRAIFFRFIGEYDAVYRDWLRDSSRTELPIYIRNVDTGGYERADRIESNTLRPDFLFSYQPTPGTVVFLGYGATLEDPDRFRFNALRRLNDGFFLKVSYLFRLD